MKVQIIIGEICSGKSSYIQKLRLKACNEGESFTKIDIGDIVREITSTENRTFDKSLDTEIISKLDFIIHQEINEFNTGLLVIGGIRQKSILEAIIAICRQHDVVDISITELQASYETRSLRYDRRQAEKDLSVSFAYANQRDKELGLKDLITYIRIQDKIPTLIINTN